MTYHLVYTVVSSTFNEIHGRDQVVEWNYIRAREVSKLRYKKKK